MDLPASQSISPRCLPLASLLLWVIVLSASTLACQRYGHANKVLAAAAIAEVSGEPAAPLPGLVLSGDHTILAFRPPDAQHPAVQIAWLAPHQQLVVVTRSPVRDHLAVQLEGDLQVLGYAPLNRVAVKVCKAGPIGTHFYAGQGNVLQLSGTFGDRLLGVEDSVEATDRPYRPGDEYYASLKHLTLRADIELDRLCDAEPKPRHAGTTDDPSVGKMVGEVDPEDFDPSAAVVEIPAETTLTLFDAPGGVPLFTRHAQKYGFEVVRVAQAHREGVAWDQVAVGGGPYLLGWMPSRPVRPPLAGGLAMLGSLSGSGSDVPWRLRERHLAKMPLRRIKAGTEVQVFGDPFAKLKIAGYARVGALSNGWRLVVAAIDHRVVIQGWVRPEALGELVDENAPKPSSIKD